MPYIARERFNPPTNQAITIWRYMDFPKFVWMLENSALYFCRVAALPDPLEGRLRRSEWSELYGPDVPKESLRLFAQFDAAAEAFARNYYVNCWHMNDSESIAMWQYGRGESGVAVRSNYTRLCKAFETASRGIHIGTVSYGPLPTQDSAIRTTYDLVLRKNPWWDWERELRAVTHVPPDERRGDATLRYGVSVPVNVGELIEAVFVAPTAPPWFATLVGALMRRYGFEQRVIPSDLLQEPPSLVASAE